VIHLIVGSVPWFQQQALTRLEKEFKGSAWSRFFGADVEARDILDTCSSLSLLGDTTTVLVRGAQHIRKAQQDILLKSLAGLPKEARLIFVADKIDKRLKFWQTLLKQAELISADPPPAKQLHPWFQKEVKHRGLKLTKAAGNSLIEVAGQDFNQAVLLLEKLELFVGDSKDVNLEIIESLRVGGQPAKIFEWAETIGGGQWKKSFSILQTLWTARESPIAIMALLVRHFRILLLACENRASWHDRGGMARRLGVPPFVVDRYCQQASRYSRDQLLSVWNELLKTDRVLKSSPIDKEIILEDLVWRLRRQRLQAAM